MVELVCKGLTKHFAGVTALQDVDLTVRGGEVLVLLGENGAGKSTLVNLVSGVHDPDAGEMRLDDEPYEPDGPAAAIAAGVGMIHQELTLLPGLSVAENILLGRQPRNGLAIDRGETRRRARELVERVGLDVDVDTRVGRLSVAQRQLVEIAKALSLDAELLILDEPTATLGDTDTDRLFELIDDLRADGTGFVYISHRLGEVERIGDRVVVLRDGELAGTFDRADVDTDELIEAMVGRTVEREYPDPPEHAQDVVLSVEDYGRGEDFDGVSFELRRGEVLGVAGLVGAGRTELARALFGAEPADRGSATLKGEAYAPATPADAVAAGVVLVPEDRKDQGLVLDHTVADNIALPSLSRLGPSVTVAARHALADETRERLQIKGRPGQPASTLSGGNQQKVVVGKWLPVEPDVVIFDEPTRGVDVGAKSAIHDSIRDLAEAGAGVIVISSELEEVLGLAHRTLVLADGSQTALLDRDEADQQTVMRHAVEG